MRRNLRYDEVVGQAHGLPKGEGNAMKCGRGHEHATVQEVKDCYGVQGSQAAASKPARKMVGDYRSNMYPGTCVVCGATVAPGQGFIFKSMGVGSQRHGQGDWLVQHIQDTCPVTPAEAAELREIKAMEPRQAPRTSKANFKAIPQGYYATKSRTGSNDLDFWFVRVPDTGKWQGYRFVRRIIGGRGPQHIRTSEQVAAMHAILEDGTDAAAHLFAQELGRCYRCGRDLTDDASRAAGIGPVCAGK